MSMASPPSPAADVPKVVSKPITESMAPGMEYMDLTQELDDSRGKSIFAAMSLTAEDDSSESSAPRVFQYDPDEMGRANDPMNFGAYNRWKKAEEALARRKQKSKPRKAKEGLSPDSFYNAIKKLGSGPKSKDVCSMLTS